MIGFAFGIVLGAIAAVFVWLYMHHKAAVTAVETRVEDYASDAWRELRALEEKLVAKIEGKQDAASPAPTVPVNDAH